MVVAGVSEATFGCAGGDRFVADAPRDDRETQWVKGVAAHGEPWYDVDSSETW
jgi:hypothetical protein